MANKLKLDQVTYLAAQRSYDGWNLFGIAILGALLSTFALAIASYRQAKEYFFSGLAFVWLAATLVLLFLAVLSKADRADV